MNTQMIQDIFKPSAFKNTLQNAKPSEILSADVAIK
jgi:hypothetical protein